MVLGWLKRRLAVNHLVVGRYFLCRAVQVNSDFFCTMYSVIYVSSPAIMNNVHLNYDTLLSFVRYLNGWCSTRALYAAAITPCRPGSFEMRFNYMPTYNDVVLHTSVFIIILLSPFYCFISAPSLRCGIVY